MKFSFTGDVPYVIAVVGVCCCRTSVSVAAPPKVAFHAFALMGLTTSMLAATVRL